MSEASYVLLRQRIITITLHLTVIIIIHVIFFILLFYLYITFYNEIQFGTNSGKYRRKMSVFIGDLNVSQPVDDRCEPMKQTSVCVQGLYGCSDLFRRNGHASQFAQRQILFKSQKNGCRGNSEGRRAAASRPWYLSSASLLTSRSSINANLHLSSELMWLPASTTQRFF